MEEFKILAMQIDAILPQESAVIPIDVYRPGRPRIFFGGNRTDISRKDE